MTVFAGILNINEYNSGLFPSLSTKRVSVPGRIAEPA